MVKNLVTDENGFMREDDSHRARFDSVGIGVWESIGGGSLRGEPDSTSIRRDAKVLPYDLYINGKQVEPHFDLDFLAEIEVHMDNGAQKYSRGNWRRVRNLTRTFNAIIRHAILAFVNDKDDNENHEAAIVANALMMWHAKSFGAK